MTKLQQKKIHLKTARWMIPSRTRSTRFLSQISSRPLKNPTLSGCDRFHSRVRFRSNDLVIFSWVSSNKHYHQDNVHQATPMAFKKKIKKLCCGPHRCGHFLQRGTRSMISLVDDQSPKLKFFVHLTPC